jgi:hypothetical protein
MNNKAMLIILLVMVSTLIIIGCTQKVTCNKQDNCCLKNEDCWSTNGGCFTNEWFAKMEAEAREKGIDNRRPTSTPEVNCTCDNSKCTVHN